MHCAIRAVLWRRVLQATIDTLTDLSRGQYHIALTSNHDIAKFFDGLVPRDRTGADGFSIDVPIAAFDGPNPVPPKGLEVRYMGPKSERKDWNIPSQRRETAYPLWRPGRGFSADTPPSSGSDTIILVRDADGRFHARWLDEAGVGALPVELRMRLQRDESGVWFHTGERMPVTARSLAVFRELKRHGNVLLYGPPGTGKTHLLREVQTLFEEGQTWLDTTDERTPIQTIQAGDAKVAFVTFHQSFGYEDFVVGLRPDPEDTVRILALKPTAGVLLELSEFARGEGRRSLLLIDEINRGNASRIFGELITLLDVDKRLEDNGTEAEQTIRVRLPYQSATYPLLVDVDGTPTAVPTPFTMPRRVYLLATMNSVDKSVAPLDAALRRRFHVEYFGPDLGEVAAKLGLEPLGDAVALPEPISATADFARLAVALLQSLNRGIAGFLGPDFQLGQWFLAPLVGIENADSMKERLISIWTNRLYPQLEEYFNGRPDQLRSLLRSPTDLDPVRWSPPAADLEDVGATGVLERQAVDSASTIRFLRRVAGVAERQL